MGMQNGYLEFFEKCAPYRLSGFQAFIGTLITYKLAWVMGFVLNYDGDDRHTRWVIALPTIIIGLLGLAHFKEIIGLASSILYS
jgi:ABC-type phosphate transport system permease subunit